MSQKEKYRCGICGHIAEASGEAPSCCGTRMTLADDDGQAPSYSGVVCSPEFPEGCMDPDE